MRRECEWTVRPGTNDTFWASTPCKPGFNYLSKVKKAESIKDVYEGRQCPICGGSIKIDMSLMETVFKEDAHIS